MTDLARVDRRPAWLAWLGWVAAAMPACRDDGGQRGDESSGSSGMDSSGAGASTGPSSSSADSSSSGASSGDPSGDPSSSESSTTEPESQCGDGQGAAGQTCFAPAQVLVQGRPTAAVAVLDVDGDDAPDVVAGHLDGWSVWLGNDTGELGEPTGGVADPIGAIALGLVDDDTAPDLVAAHPQLDLISVRLGDGSGGFGAPLVLMVDADGSSGSASPRALALADFDGDGDTDVAVASELDAQVRVFFQELGSFDDVVELATGGTPVALAAGRLGDGVGPDLAIPNFAGATVGLLLHTEGQSFASGPSLAVGVGPRAVVAIDLDGDGTDDVATADGDGGSASVLLRQGRGFAAAQVIAVGSQPRAIARGDFDNDGNADLAVALETSDAVGVLLRDAEAEGFAMLPVQTTGTHARPDSIATGDLNGDGIDDLVTGSAAAGGGVALLLSDP